MSQKKSSDDWFVVELAEADIWKRRFVRKRWVNSAWEDVDVSKFMYQSMFSWECELKDAQENIETDMVVMHDLLFDFDNLNLEYALADARNFALHLETKTDVSPADLRYYFSGCKGFHIVLPAALFGAGGFGIHLHIATIKAFARELAGIFRSFDYSVYKRRQLIRLPNSYNAAGQLWKVQLTPHEFMNLSIDEIQYMAQKQREPLEYEELSPNEVLMQSLQQHCLNQSMAESAVVTQRTQTSSYSLDTLFSPAPVGDRNNRAAALAGLLVKRFDDFTLLCKILSLWNSTNKVPLPPRELIATAQSIYKKHTHNYRGSSDGSIF